MNKEKKALLIFLLLIFILFGESQAFFRTALFIDLSRVEPRQTGWPDAWATGFGAALPLTRHLAFFLNFGRWRFQLSPRDTRLFAGQLTLSPLMSGLYFLVFPRYSVSPLLSFGAGYIFSQYRHGDPDLITIPEVIRISKKVGGNFAWEAGAGLQFRISSRSDLWVEVVRYQSSLKIITTVVDMNLGTRKESMPLNITPYLYRLGFRLAL